MHLHVSHNNHLKKMTNMQTIGSGVKTNIKSYFLVREKVADFLPASRRATATIS